MRNSFMKRVLSLSLAAVLTVSSVPVNAMEEMGTAGVEAVSESAKTDSGGGYSSSEIL